MKIDHEALKMKRLRAGKAANKVAIAMGISPQYLSDLEQGRRDWDADKLQKFEKALTKR